LTHTVYDTLIDSSVSAVRAEVVQDNISRHCPRCFSPDTSGFGCPGDGQGSDGTGTHRNAVPILFLEPGTAFRFFFTT